MVKSNKPVPRVFKFEDSQSGRYWHIRLVGSPEIPEWVFSDIVAVLYPEVKSEDYSNYFASVPAAWKSQKQMITPEGEQLVSTLYEAGLYYLISRSSSPLMLTFQEWVKQEILPAIRPDGSYFIVGSSFPEVPSTKEQLETVRLGMNLLYELGGIDEYTRLVLREKVKNILLEDALQESSPYFTQNSHEINNLDSSFSPNRSLLNHDTPTGKPKLVEETTTNGDRSKG
jgi:prophage antirepressor-like protein